MPPTGSHSRRPRALLHRRSCRGDRQDHRAGRPHRQRARSRHRRDHRRDRRRHLHGEGGGRAETATPRGARDGARRREAGDERARLEQALRVSRGGARQHDSRVLRRPAARAAGRSARRSAVPGADRRPGVAHVRRGVRRVAAGSAARSGRGRQAIAATAGAPELRRRDRRGRTGRAVAPGGHGRCSTGATIRRAWRRNPFDREREIARMVERCLAFAATVTANPIVGPGSPLRSTSRRHARVRRGHRGGLVPVDDLDGLEATLVDLHHNRRFAKPRKGSGAGYSRRQTRAAVWDARQQLFDALGDFERRANADLAAALQIDLQGEPRALRGAEGGRRRAGLRRSAAAKHGHCCATTPRSGGHSASG